MRRHGHALGRRYGRMTNGIAAGAEPWSADEARKHRAIAQRLFSEPHYEPGHTRNPDPDNCSACAIRGLGGDIEEGGPNYAGWARIYIEAGKTIPSRWRDAFQRELHSDNEAYANALRRSIATFGGPRFT